MTNDPELSGKYLGTISSDFVKVADSLKEASYQIRKAGFEFPIFAICKTDQPVGQLLLDIHKAFTSSGNPTRPPQQKWRGRVGASYCRGGVA